ncbi:methyl-accepting chemotaxis protein [Salicola sp. Rm-C-2C1-2]|uniref:methyl-accepting chemotaxis protein n=1 Tax=Salicola sp. Rm-C-2C1-2 TaxID=3141321 RepID=UPI0032E49E16
MLQRLSIALKLALLVGITVIALIVTQGFNLYTQSQNADRLNLVDEELYPTMELATVNLGQLELMEAQINSAVTTGNEDKLAETETYHKTIQDNLSELKTTAPEMRDRFNRLSQELERYYSEATRIASAFIEGDADMSALSQDASANSDRLKQLKADMKELRDQARSDFNTAIDDTVTTTEQSTTLGLTIATIAIVALVVLSLLIARSITNSLNRVIQPLRDMASGEGDLTSRIDYDGGDELKELVTHFNAFIEKLHTAFSTISTDVAGLEEVSQKLSATSSTNLKRINEQSSAIASARNSVDELVKSVEEVANFATNASEQTQGAAEYANRGKDHVSGNVQTIQDLAQEIDQCAELVNQFESHSNKVAGLLDTIKTVTEQTNLLALNAAIEAARAGDHGRGFAVVADEVRNLAVRTQQSAQEIETVISELSNLAESSVKAMQSSVEKARTGVDATRESGEVLQSILENVESISSINEQIAAATHEQTATFNDVVTNISDIHSNAEQVIETTQELDKASQDSREITQRLHQIASQFRV